MGVWFPVRGAAWHLRCYFRDRHLTRATASPVWQRVVKPGIYSSASLLLMEVVLRRKDCGTSSSVGGVLSDLHTHSDSHTFIYVQNLIFLKCFNNSIRNRLDWKQLCTFTSGLLHWRRWWRSEVPDVIWTLILQLVITECRTITVQRRLCVCVFSLLLRESWCGKH